MYCITLFARACARSAFASNDISYLRGSSRCLRSDLSEPPPPPLPVELNGIGDPIYCLAYLPTHCVTLIHLLLLLRMHYSLPPEHFLSLTLVNVIIQRADVAS